MPPDDQFRSRAGGAFPRPRCNHQNSHSTLAGRRLAHQQGPSMSIQASIARNCSIDVGFDVAMILVAA